MFLNVENYQFIDIHIHSTCNDQDVLTLRNLEYHEHFEPGIISANDCFSIGIHPWNADKAGNDLFSGLENVAGNKNVIAIGETGLDKLCGIDYKRQEFIFEKQLNISKSVNKPVIIHCVRAYQEIIALRKKYNFQPWILHRFNASEEIARQVSDLGFYLSFGNLILNPATKAAKILSKVPVNRVFFETDDFGISIREIYSAASKILDMDLNELRVIIKNNFRNCFNLKND